MTRLDCIESEGMWPPTPVAGEEVCGMCRGEGAVGTGYGGFVDASDAMPCPRCEGAGVVASGQGGGS